MVARATAPRQGDEQPRQDCPDPAPRYSGHGSAHPGMESNRCRAWLDPIPHVSDIPSIAPPNATYAVNLRRGRRAVYSSYRTSRCASICCASSSHPTRAAPRARIAASEFTEGRICLKRMAARPRRLDLPRKKSWPRWKPGYRIPGTCRPCRRLSRRQRSWGRAWPNDPRRNRWTNPFLP